MKILILSDIHGNFEALKTSLTEAEKKGFNKIIFLGDLCGYGPHPQECFNLLQEKKSIILVGNHDLYECGRIDRNFFSDRSLKSLILTSHLIDLPTKNILSILNPSKLIKKSLYVHGSPLNPETGYILNYLDAEKNFKAFKEQICFFGHTHVPAAYLFDKKTKTIEEISPIEGESISYKKKRVLFNPGSIGQPRDGNSQSSWAILDAKEKKITLYRTPYNISKTQESMKKLSLEEHLIKRLDLGE